METFKDQQGSIFYASDRDDLIQIIQKLLIYISDVCESYGNEYEALEKEIIKLGIPLPNKTTISLEE